MCNRYALSKKQERVILQDYETLDLYFTERFNIAPTQSAPVVLIDEGKPVCRELKWGFTPKWSKAPVTNAQFETLDEKQIFKEAFEGRRCLVPASGFYEWISRLGGRQPVLFLLNDERLFFFAGLYSAALDSFVIITTAANSFVRGVHNRMPLILSPGDYTRWLGPKSQNYKTVLPTTEEMKTYWVGAGMNNSRTATSDDARPIVATVKSMHSSYPLPAGLPENATVKIRSFNGGFHEVEFNGNVFDVFMGCVSFKGETGMLL
jgi:putative SOS response-associated peptidase YedK